MMRNAYCVRRGLRARAGSEWAGCRSRLLLFLARSSWLVARSFGGLDDVHEGSVADCGVGRSGVARRGGPGVVAGHAQASLERGTRGAGGGPGAWDAWNTSRPRGFTPRPQPNGAQDRVAPGELDGPDVLRFGSSRRLQPGPVRAEGEKDVCGEVGARTSARQRDWPGVEHRSVSPSALAPAKPRCTTPCQASRSTGPPWSTEAQWKWRRS